MVELWPLVLLTTVELGEQVVKEVMYGCTAMVGAVGPSLEAISMGRLMVTLVAIQ